MGTNCIEREGEYSSTLWDGNSMNGEQLEVECIIMFLN